MSRRRWLLIAGLIVPHPALVRPAAAPVEDSVRRADSARARRLDPMIVSAVRAPRPLSEATASVTRLSRSDLNRLPVGTVAQALEFVPGIAVLQADGLGEAPQVVARGFYGGGETDYVLLLLDGVPLNGLVSGAANLDLVPLALVESIEVVRGAAASRSARHLSLPALSAHRRPSPGRSPSPRTAATTAICCEAFPAVHSLHPSPALHLVG